MERTLRMCDYKFDDERVGCDRASSTSCSVCRNDMCEQHTMPRGLNVLIDTGSEHYVGAVLLANICRRCGTASSTDATKTSIGDLFRSIKEPLLEIFRAQQVAEALK